MHKLLILIAAVLTVAGCASKDKNEEPKKEKVPVTGLATLSDVCNVPTMQSQRDRTLTSVRGWEEQMSDRGLYGQINLIQQYQAEVEVGYRSIVSSCGLLASCMRTNRGDERLCSRSADQYDRAQERFAEQIAYGAVLQEKVREAIIAYDQQQKEAAKHKKTDKTVVIVKDGDKCKADKCDCDRWSLFDKCECSSCDK